MKKKNDNKKIGNFSGFLSYAYYKFKQWSFVKHLLLFYLFITVIGSLLLFIPISHKNSVNIEYIDALFTSASAFSDTGLSTLTTSETWTVFGQSIIAILILIGGCGWFALKFYLFNILLGRPISFRARETLAGERGSSKLGNTRQIVKISVSILFILVISATIILTIYFYFSNPDQGLYNKFANTKIDPKEFISSNPNHDVITSLRFGAFHAISALNNAGFDIIGNSSLVPYYHDYGLQIIFIVLFVIGGIGYPVIYDIYMWTKSKFLKQNFRWSLFTKLSMTTYVLIALIGLSLTFALEVPKENGFWQNGHGTTSDKTMALIFNTMSTRNAGFASIPMGELSNSTHFLYSILMFIGSAPSSTAGGIRTTTLAIMILGLWSRIRGRKSVRVFNRRIPYDTVTRSFVVMLSSFMLVFIGTLVMVSSLQSYGGKLPSNVAFDEILFEVSSAFGTTGLSTGLTPGLSTITKLTLIIIMFVGQLGVSSSILVWNNKKAKAKKYNYVEEDVSIG